MESPYILSLVALPFDTVNKEEHSLEQDFLYPLVKSWNCVFFPHTSQVSLKSSVSILYRISEGLSDSVLAKVFKDSYNPLSLFIRRLALEVREPFSVKALIWLSQSISSCLENISIYIYYIVL